MKQPLRILPWLAVTFLACLVLPRIDGFTHVTTGSGGNAPDTVGLPIGYTGRGGEWEEIGILAWREYRDARTLLVPGQARTLEETGGLD